MTSRALNVESVAHQLLSAYGIQTPPVPLEAILQHPLPDMCHRIDLAVLPDTFFAQDDPYRPRQALAHLLVCLLADSEWGSQHGLAGVASSADKVNQLARAILMPRDWLSQLPPAALEPGVLGALYQVPVAEAIIRLQELDVFVS